MTVEDRMLPKREAMESLLEQGDVLLQLDPRAEGVQVPDCFGNQPMLVLRIGLEMPIPIPDLQIDDEGVRATLSFDRTPHEVVLPWEAIFGMVTERGRGLLWTADVPLEIIDQMLLATRGSDPGVGGAADPASEAHGSGRPRLVALDGGRTDPGPPPPSSPEGGSPGLRLIK